MEFNFVFILLSALIPTAVGFIYYHPKLVGTAWMKATGITEEKMKTANRLVILVVGLLLSILLAVVMAIVSTHQTDVFSLFNGNEALNDPASEVVITLNHLLTLAGDRYLTFGHGVAHGILISLFLVFPILTINNMNEMRPFKLTLINFGYWLITLSLMAGVLCKWGFQDFVAG